ncbi:MAG: hypothetical protein ACTIDN_00205 [Acetobacter sp.]|uniref:hypothetical protein n=1 Tax=Acetobacter sp. TaxID=440 RepID=UPI003F93016A
MSRPNTPALPHRQPVQIALDSDNGSLVTLCNDGTIWTIIMGLPEDGWEQLPAIPQPDMPATPTEEQTYPEPDQTTCPVRCLGTVECAETGKIEGYSFRDAAGNERTLTSRDIENRHTLLSLFGGNDTWLRQSFPKQATITKSVSGIRYPEEVTVDFCVDAAAAHLKERCEIVESIVGSLNTISEAQGSSGKPKDGGP